MSASKKTINHTPAIVLGLAIALGPLTALSVGSRYASEETFARAQAGAENIQRRERQAAQMRKSEDVQGLPAYASGETLADGQGS